MLYIDFKRINVRKPNEPMAEGEDLKEWVFTNYKEEILDAMTLHYEEQVNELQVTKQKLVLLDQIANVQRQYLQQEPPNIVFGTLLASLLELMNSEYGFIGEIKYDEDGSKFLQTHAITNIAWNTATRTFYDENMESGLKFTNLNTLFGHVIKTGEPLIANAPKDHPSSRGIPEGHPPLNHFLGIPFHQPGGKMTGMVGISNKPGGYSEKDIEFLEPFLLTCSNLIQAYNAIRQNEYLINTLEEKVEVRTKALKLANDRLEEANRKVLQNSAAQLEHFACMSHEIRTPLNCIIGISSLLIETQLDPMQEESLRMMITSGELLLTVVNDVLDYSKLVSGKVEISLGSTNLQETLDAVVHSINMKAVERNVSIRCFYGVTVPEFIHTDSRRLQQILYNLLGNAVKFSKEGGLVELHLNIVDSDAKECKREPVCNEANSLHQPGMSIQNGSGSRCPFHRETSSKASQAEEHVAEESPRAKKVLRFIVKDYGRGIERKNFKKIFQPFLQASANETEQIYGGTGLGLAITYKLATQLGGSIVVDSVIDEWSEFTLEFPFDGEEAPVDEIIQKLSRARLLLVSNDDDDRPSSVTVDRFQIDMTCVESLFEFGDPALLETLCDPSRVNVCIIREDLYVREEFEVFKQRTGRAKSLLLTFGPKYLVKDSTGHFRSLGQMLPCVLTQSIASYVDSTINKAPVGNSRELADTLEPVEYDKLRVLIAEDNIINQKVLNRMLIRMGLKHIVIVDNGQKAVNESARTEFDLIFMDMQMPVMGGLEACRLITERRKDSDKPKVVFVTANVSETYETKAADVGADGFISKPYNVQKIDAFFKSMR